MSEEEFIECYRCRGTGEYVECIDDLCHARGECMHGDNTCTLCDGHGRISRTLADRWARREPFEAVGLPEADRRFRRSDS